jgi:hypothetical protein
VLEKNVTPRLNHGVSFLFGFFLGRFQPKTWFNLHNIKIRFAGCSWVKDINKPLVRFFILKKLGLPGQGFPLGYEMFWSGPVYFPWIRLMWVLANGLT